MLREIWRVMADGGRLVTVAPTRAGLWSQIDRSPFYQGHPYSAGQLASLLRDWMSGAGAPAMQQAQRDAEQAALPWLAQTLAAGQAIGAIRTDIPDTLLLAISTAIGRVIDSWVIAEATDPDEKATAVHTILAILRRAIRP